jgi:hypothetical protein
MSPFLSRMMSCVLAAAWIGAPAVGQTWNTAYYEDAADNEVESVARLDDGGYIAVGHFSGVGTLFRLQPTGSVDWARGYGPVRPAAVRAVPGGGTAWIGNVPDPDHPIPIFVLTNSVGALLKTVRFSVPNTLRSEVTALEIDPRDNGFWVGGNAWFTTDLQEPWLAHFDATGKLLSIGAFQLPAVSPPVVVSARIEALVPTGTPGVIAVGRWFVDTFEEPTAKNSMFALRLDGEGGLAWARSYREAVTRSLSEQWFVDVARDPRTTFPVVYALGRADQICGIDRASQTALPCVDGFTGPVVVALDETTGNVVWSTVLETAKHAVVFNPTAIARDDGLDQLAIGGSLDDGTPGNREAVLARIREAPASPVPLVTLLGAETFGDGAGPFVSEVADLALSRLPSAPASTPGFVLANHQSKTGVDRPTVVTIDSAGHSDGKCEEPVDLSFFPSTVYDGDVPLTPAVASTDTYAPLLSLESVTWSPCSTIGSAEPSKTAHAPAPAPKAVAKCATPEHRQFDFWVGDWDAYDVGAPGKVVARNRVDLILDGCALREVYEQTDGLTGQSFSLYDASRQVWHQSWVTNSGQLLTIEGRFENGRMTLAGTRLVEGHEQKVRGVWYPEKDGVRSVRERAESSDDGGKTWKPLFDIVFRPHKT